MRLLVVVPVLAVVSLGWMVFVALTPVRGRPYVDGSTGDSVFAQVFGYNGVGRFGSGPAYGLGYLGRPTASSLAYLRHVEAVTTLEASWAHPAWERLLTAPLAQVTGWLLVPALVVAVGAVIAVGRARGQEARRAHAPLLAWGLWLLAFAVVFSVSGGVSYYFAILSPAIAALCALGGRAAIRWQVGAPGAARRRQLWLAAGGTVTALCSAGVLAEPGPSWRWVAVGAGGTALVAGCGTVYLIAAGYLAPAGYVTPPGCLAPAGYPVPAGRAGRRGGMLLARVLLSLTAAAALAGPVVADGWLIEHRAGPFDSLLGPEGTFADMGPSLSAALNRYPGYGGTIIPVTTTKLWSQLQAYGQQQNRLVPPGTWAAVYGSAEASDAVLGGARRVLPIGGYTGLVPTPTAGQLTAMLARNEIMYALIPGSADPRWSDPRVRAIVRWCRPEAPVGENVRDVTATAQPWACRRQ